ncbi:response regulator [Coraliomargarita parva]|uniref:response regulator n=1 Tax=Coraliomargarita parva TaxID=3014050 RepID=UPI0022B35340|nr:response regulator [Coraliomargarita parva]
MKAHTVLVIEDNIALREMTRRRLERHGYKIVLAEDGEEGLALLQDMKPDIILLDMSLPGKDGWTVAGELKDCPRCGTIPLIAITAHAMRGDREKAIQSGCDDYVSKPIDFSILTSKMNALLEPHES